MRLIGWIILVSLMLAALRLAIILAALMLLGFLVWGLFTHPQHTLSAIVLFVALSIVKTAPISALLVFGAGLALYQR